jgi:ABC-type branched-subunit amino acid transport system substrate-binding protein
VFVAPGAPADWGGNIVKRFGSLAALLAVVLVLGACGRSSDDSATPTPGGDDTTTTTAAGSGGPGDFGTLTEVCGPGESTKSPDQGVTADTINIATSADPGFTGRRGLNQEIFDASDVFVAWCNEAGGINGRKITLHKYDAALLNYDAQVQKACATDFLLVGNGNVFDGNPAQTTRLKCLLPEIPTYLVTIEGRESDLSVQPVPNRATQYQILPFNYVDQAHPDATDAVVTLTGNVEATQLVDAQATEVAKGLGWTVKSNLQYNALGEPTWVPVAQKIKDAGAKGLIYTGEPQNYALLAKALKQINYPLDFTIVAANHYDQNIIKDGGGAVDNVYMTVGFVPYEQAGENPPTQQYLDLFEKYKPNGKARAALGLQTFSAWLLFAEAAKACGDDLTRKCVYDNALKVGGTDWTGGGLNAPQNVQDQKASTCGIVLDATPDGFVVPDDFEINSNDFFNCDPSNVYELKGDYSQYGTGVTLESVGKSLDDLK